MYDVSMYIFILYWPYAATNEQKTTLLQEKVSQLRFCTIKFTINFKVVLKFPPNSTVFFFANLAPARFFPGACK